MAQTAASAPQGEVAQQPQAGIPLDAAQPAPAPQADGEGAAAEAAATQPGVWEVGCGENEAEREELAPAEREGLHPSLQRI
jgi:hypothetical protein